MSNGRKELIKSMSHAELLDLASYYTNLIRTIGSELNEAPFGVNLEMFDELLELIDENAQEVLNIIKERITEED